MTLNCSRQSYRLARGGEDINVYKDNKWAILGASSSVSIALSALVACGVASTAPALAAAVLISGVGLIATQTPLFDVFVPLKGVSRAPMAKPKTKTIKEKFQEALYEYPNTKIYFKSIYSVLEGHSDMEMVRRLELNIQQISQGNRMVNGDFFQALTIMKGVLEAED